ncbi:serine/threonine protein phosphatase [Rhodosalinus halophilus]|uniref:Serine/threonine protein phosphatase n=1 Tax=Rhodosalinus halophilus TaxID=2259333 RepID=A0A365UD10_9RHOB|nr:serine/threonine protein phosphatase [Rhodosalinus halophilus]
MSRFVIRSLISRRRRADRPAEAETPFAPPRPDRPFVAVGDIHGRLDLLQQLETQLADLPADWPVVFVGDYIDRGDESAGVLRHLFGTSGRQRICLMGNHEEMLLRFLAEPAAEGPRWLRNGGLQTLASFGLGGLPTREPAAYVAARDALVDAMGLDLIDWLTARPLVWWSGDVAVVHAGADPGLPIAKQPSETLLWGHPEFAWTPRADGLWVVHGHTIVDAPEARAGRVPIDTGAYATGRLTAALVEAGGVRFRQTGR